eukprot:SAG31_NODE_22812_length_517_cov_0.952153_2_plen_43_part_01
MRGTTAMAPAHLPGRGARGLHVVLREADARGVHRVEMGRQDLV